MAIKETAAPDPETLFRALKGEWQLERVSDDGAVFSGRAVFSACGTTALLLNESGTMLLPGGKALAASRQWLWRFHPPSGIDIHYHAERDNAVYHKLALILEGERWIAQASHLCEADTYFSRYAFIPAEFTMDHFISGPAKALVLKARYVRVG